MLISPVLMTTAVNRRLIDCMKLSATALSHHHHPNRSPAAPSARDPPMCHKSAIPPGASDSWMRLLPPRLQIVDNECAPNRPRC